MSDDRMMAAYIAGTVALTEHAPEMGKISRTVIAQIVSAAAIKAYLSEKPAARLTILESAMRRIHEAIPKYVCPEPTMTADEFINVVLSAADDQEVVRAMRGLGK